MVRQYIVGIFVYGGICTWGPRYVVGRYKKAVALLLYSEKVGILSVNTSGDDDQFKAILARFESILP